MSVSRQQPKIAPLPTAVAGAPISAGGGLEQMVERNLHYRKSYELLVTIVLVQLAAVLALGWGLLQVIEAHGPRDNYVPVSEWGDLLGRTPVNRHYARYFDRTYAANSPNAGEWLEDDAAVLAWAEDAVVETMTFTYMDWQMRLQQASSHFSSVGVFDGFMKTLTDNTDSVLNQVRGDGRYILKTEIVERAKILAKDVNKSHNAAFWRVGMRVRQTYDNEKGSNIVPVDIELVVARVSTAINPRGVAIAQWVARTPEEKPEKKK